MAFPVPMPTLTTSMRTEWESGMSSEHEGPYVPAGAVVEDSNGARVGEVRAVYPHYVAVGDHGEHPQAYRVPLRAIVLTEDNLIRLSIPKDVLDPMTAQELAALGLPEHGGEIVVGSPLEEARHEEEESIGISDVHDR
jgi:hypothetical protein